MTQYIPAYQGTVTKYVVLDSSEITSLDLATRAYELSKGIMIKETCFGLVICGEREEVGRLISQIREIDPDHIFVKDRGFPPGDARRCRANLGGSRPGFHGLERETLLLPYISAGLEAIRTAPDQKRESLHPQESPRLDIYRLKKMIDTLEP